jgi:hypothetical protein
VSDAAFPDVPPAAAIAAPLNPPPVREYDRRHDWLAVVVLTLLATIFFADVLFGFSQFYMRDLTRYYYPTKQVLREIVQHGEFPYWNRYFSAGQPIAANPEHEVFYPLTWLILLPSYDLGFRLHILAHIYIGLLGMYALLRSMKLHPFAAFFGAISFGFGGVYLSYINLLPILFCAAWLPLICLFARRFLIRRTLRDFVLASLFLGVECLVGEPTTVMQTGFLLGCYGLYRAWYSNRRVTKTITRTLWIAAMTLTAIAVGAAQIIPALDHVHDSARSRPFGFDLVSSWSMPWAKFAELVFPNILGHISIKQVMWYWGGGLYPGMGSPFIFSIYVGLLVVALTVGGAFTRPRGGRFVLLIGLFSILMALGGHTPLLKFLYDHHIASSIRYPEKFVLLGLFTVIVFAARMLDRLLHGDEAIREGALGFTIAVTAVSFALAAIGFTPLYGRTFMHIWGYTPGAVATRMITLSHHDWIIAAIRGAALIALLWGVRRWPRHIWIGAATLFLILDLAPVVHELNPRMPRRFFDSPPAAATIPANRKDFRVFHEADWYGQEDIAKNYFSTGEAVYWVVRNGLFPMTPAGSHVQTVLERDYDKTALLPTIDLTDAIWDMKRSGRTDWAEPFMAMSNAWYRGEYRPFPAEKVRNKGNFKESLPVRFVEGFHYPRYYFANQLITIKDTADFTKKLIEGNYSRQVAFITQPGFVPARGVVHKYTETANSATIDVESFGQGFLVMSVTPHKYWRIIMDGQRVPAIVTNIAYQGIIVTPGRHTIVMRYSNELVQVGLAISLVSILVLVSVAVIARRRSSYVAMPAYEEPIHVVADAQGTHTEPVVADSFDSESSYADPFPVHDGDGPPGDGHAPAVADVTPVENGSEPPRDPERGDV